MQANCLPQSREALSGRCVSGSTYHGGNGRDLVSVEFNERKSRAKKGKNRKKLQKNIDVL